MSMTIEGLATAQPPRSVPQPLAAEMMRAFVGDEGESRGLAELFAATQIGRRASVVLEPGEGWWPQQTFYPAAASSADLGPGTAARMERYAREAGPLLLTAARKAIADAGLDAADCSHLITVSCTGFHSPGLDYALIRGLCLPPSVGRLHVGFMGCHAALNGLRAAQAFVESGGGRVLLGAVELCSLHFQYGAGREKWIANALFADGAAALVAGPGPQAPGRWKVVECGSMLLPNSEADMGWRVGDHGFEMSLSVRVPDAIRQHLRPWLEQWLGRSGRRIEGVGSWAIHPGGPKILSTVADALGLPRAATEASAQVLAECGNMSSPTLLFVLERLARLGAPRPCVALAFGPGLVAEAALLE